MPGGSASRIRRRLNVHGQVQGVGFRPYVYRLATECGLHGFVANNQTGVVIDIEGTPKAVDEFEYSLVRNLPPLAHIERIERTSLPVCGASRFRISGSRNDAGDRPDVTPDAATCRDCLEELFDPSDRRFRYPFINCTNCGPRYSIICEAPYDRPGTTMAEFTMCCDCRREYEDPGDRRFHAQPNACPACGPHLEYWQKTPPVNKCRTASPGRCFRRLEGDPVRLAARLLTGGGIVAIKGIGGYHLACRADCDGVVARLRARKLRDGKPLAIMVPNLDAARLICRLSTADENALQSPAAPIVLAPKREQAGIASSVAPHSADFGVMLPYAPLHHLLFSEGLGPLVMTSGNLTGQPLVYEDNSAFESIGDVADAFLMHNRRIFRPIDDSVVFTFGEHIAPIRRARGYAPQPLRLHVREAVRRGPRILAVGGELKSTVCLLNGDQALLSEHLGDLTRPDAYRNFARAVERLRKLYAFDPEVVAHDMHPQYLSTRFARHLAIDTVPVQHHHAHIVSVMAEHNEYGPLIGVACDGTGYGTDGAVWGCELLHCRGGDFERLGHLDYFPLVGGDLAAIETWRPAAALLREAFGESWPDALHLCVPSGPSAESLRTFEAQASRGLNAPPTSSLGRLFDAVSYLLGLCGQNRHEAEAAMALEDAAGHQAAEPFSYRIVTNEHGTRLRVGDTIRQIVSAIRAGDNAGRLAARFHETVVSMLADAVHRACRQCNVQLVALSGGCFANRRLLRGLVERLERDGLRVLYNTKVPCGDGGLSLGQAMAAAWKLAGQSRESNVGLERVSCA